MEIRFAKFYIRDLSAPVLKVLLVEFYLTLKTGYYPKTLRARFIQEEHEQKSIILNTSLFCLIEIFVFPHFYNILLF